MLTISRIHQKWPLTLPAPPSRHAFLSIYLLLVCSFSIPLLCPSFELYSTGIVNSQGILQPLQVLHLS